MPVPSLAALKADLRALETNSHEQAGGGAYLALGADPVDKALQGGLALSALHEITGPAVSLFTAILLARRPGPAIWISPGRALDLPYPPGLAALGGDPVRLIFVVTHSLAEMLTAAYEALACPGIAMVICDLTTPLSLDQGRKLQLAARRGNALGLLVDRRPSGGLREHMPLAAAVTTRWHAALAGPLSYPDSCRLRLDLVKNRRGNPGTWEMEWCYETHHLRLAAQARERTHLARHAALG